MMCRKFKSEPARVSEQRTSELARELAIWQRFDFANETFEKRIIRMFVSDETQKTFKCRISRDLGWNLNIMILTLGCFKTTISPCYRHILVEKGQTCNEVLLVSEWQDQRLPVSCWFWWPWPQRKQETAFIMNLLEFLVENMTYNMTHFENIQVSEPFK